MGQVIVTTGWHPAGYGLYGKQFADGFATFWPTNYQMVAYVEETVVLPRGACRSLWDIPGAKAFIERHQNNAEANGRKPNDKWKPKHKTRGYNFRFDAVKFCRQMFIPSDASAKLAKSPDDIIVWLDGDVKTDAKVPDRFVETVIGDADLVYLGRNGYHSELGFWACRNNDRGRIFMDSLAKTFETDAVFKLSEWHSAWVFDHCRADCKKRGLRAMNLTPGGTGHVWFQSPLREFSDHMKGARKQMGGSPERRRA